MKKLGNVLYVTTPEAYLSLDGENVVVAKRVTSPCALPLHNLESIVCFNYPGVSPALMGACAERHVGLSFLKPSGRFLARVTGGVQGNLLLRKRQYELASKEDASGYRPSCLLGKIANSRKVIERALRDHAMLVDVPALEAASASLKETLVSVENCTVWRPCAVWKGTQPNSTSGSSDNWFSATGGFSFRRSRPPAAG